MDETIRRTTKLLTVLSPKRKKEILKSLGPVSIERPPFLDLERASLCSECSAVFGNGATCPRCESTAVLGLWRVIPTETSSARLKLSKSKPTVNPDSFYRPVSIAS